jgi:type IV secretion system protein VirB8
MTAPEKTDNKNQKFKIKSWYSNRYQIVVVQRNILFFFSVFSVISMTITIFFVKYVVSNKSLDPYVIEVEDKTGVPTVVDQMTSKTFTGDEAVKKYFLNQFIMAAIGYDPRTYKQDVEKVRLYATPAVYSIFRRAIDPKELGSDSGIDVRIKSIQFPDPGTAQLRILRTINKKGEAMVTKNEVLTINFYFTSNMELTVEERLINPLGFQVTNYLLSEEIFNY